MQADIEKCQDQAAGTQEVIRLERRAGTAETGPFVLWYVQTSMSGGATVSTQEFPLLENLTDLTFILEYEVGPRLRRATLDMTILPDDLQDLAIGDNLDTPTIRMVASAAPRQQD